jgi:hypothetical protein
MDYTEEQLHELIDSAAERGRPELVNFYKSELARVQAKESP